MKTINKLISCTLLSLLFSNLSAQTATDYTTLYDRIYSTNLGSGTSSYNLANVNSDGTFVNVLTYPTVQPTPNTGNPRAHLDEMLKIARAYQSVAGPQYHSVDLLNAYLNTWNWWMKFDPKDTNWWYRSIGWPKSLYPSFVLMGRDLKILSPTDYANLLQYFMNEWTPANIATYTSSPTGANTTDVCNYIMNAAIVDQNTTTINQVMGIIAGAISISSGDKSEGIQPDYGFNQHTGYGRQLYLANYGKEYINGIINFITLTAGTSFQATSDKITIFENFFLNNVSWVVYRNMMDQNQYGRFPQMNYYTIFPTYLSKLISANTPQKASLQSLYNWMTRSTATNATNVQQGNKMFWRYDYMVHKGANYFVTSRMTSTRTVGCESGYADGHSNYYTGAGVNYLYVTGSERSEILADQNWRRLPGITSPQKDTAVALPLVDWGVGAGNLDAYAGGATDGSTGVSGFVYSKNGTETNLKAYKSNFYFKDFYVALGAGITAGTNFSVPYCTTVNQVKYNGAFALDNNGVVTTLAMNKTLNPIKSSWAYINGIGYHFITNTQLNYQVDSLGLTPIAWIGINHGNMPVNQTYAYAVYPNLTQAQTQTKAATPPFSIVSNTTSTQAVADITNKIVQIVFYKAGKLSLPSTFGTCTVSAPAIIQLRWVADSLYLSAANPYCETTPLTTLTVKVNGKFNSSSTVTVNKLDSTIITVNMPQNEFQGQSIVVGLKKIAPTALVECDTTSNAMIICPGQVSKGEQINVKLPYGFDANQKLKIYNAEGNLINRGLKFDIFDSNILIDTNGLASGIYILKYLNLNGRFIVK